MGWLCRVFLIPACTAALIVGHTDMLIGDPEPSASLRPGDPAPAFSMKTVNPNESKESSFALSRHVGEKPDDPRRRVILSFAASYCEPCKKELAELRELEGRLSKANVGVAVIIIDTKPEGIEKMRRLTVDELKLPFPVLVDRFGVLARRYGAHTLPYLVVIARTGMVEWVHSGFQTGSLDIFAERLGL